MDKSMVHELNPLFASNVQYPRSSFIHTVYQTDFNELRKSRIQNLPNYRKDDLSSKLNFVIVFQAIQIQRLSVQIETLRVKIKDYERQLCNQDNYEVQIRELTQKCHAYETQKQDHQEGMEKMHKICQQLYNELEEMRNRYADVDLSLKQKYRLEKERSEMLASQIEKWKARYNASQTSKSKELDDMRLMLENQRKSILQREMRQISIKYESEHSMLENELRKLRQNLEHKTFEVQRLRNELQETKMRANDMKQYESRLDEYQDKLMMMAQENMRLNELLRAKKEEIQSLKDKERNFEIKLDNLSKLERQFMTISKKIQIQDSEIREWNQKYARLQAQNNRNAILSNKAQQYERLLDNSAEEMERMNTIIRDKIAEVDRFKVMYQKIQIDLAQTQTIQQQIYQYENHMQQITNENQRLNDQLRARLQDVQLWKAKYAQIQSKLPSLNQFKDQSKNLRQKLAVEVSTRAKLSETISALEKDLAKSAEIQQKLIKERGINKDLQREIQRLSKSIKSISSQNNDYTRKIQSLEIQLKQNSSILEQLEQCKRKINMMIQELDRINGVIHQKLQQIKQLKQNYNSVSINNSRIRQIQEQLVANLGQTEKLFLKLDDSRKQNQFLNEKLLNNQIRTKKLEEEILNNNEEKEKLISIVSKKKVELEDLVNRMQKADQKISFLQTVEQDCKSLKNNNAQLTQSFKDLQNKYSKQIQRSSHLSKQIESLSSEIIKLQNQSNLSKQFIAQFNNLKMTSEQQDKIIALLVKRIAIVQKIILFLKQQGQKNCNKICVHNQKWKQLNNNFEVVAILMNKVVEMYNQIQKLSEENFQLQTNTKLQTIEQTESFSASVVTNTPEISSSHLFEKQNTAYQRPAPTYQTQEEVFQKVRSTQTLMPKSTKVVLQQTSTRQNPSNNNLSSSFINANDNLNYYQNHMRERQGAPSKVYQSSLFYQRPPEVNTVQYKTSSLRPGNCQQNTTTYTYSSNFDNSNYFNPTLGNSNPVYESQVQMQNYYGSGNISPSQAYSKSTVGQMNIMNTAQKMPSPAKRMNGLILSEKMSSPDLRNENNLQAKEFNQKRLYSPRNAFK